MARKQSDYLAALLADEAVETKAEGGISADGAPTSAPPAPSPAPPRGERMRGTTLLGRESALARGASGEVRQGEIVVGAADRLDAEVASDNEVWSRRPEPERADPDITRIAEQDRTARMLTARLTESSEAARHAWALAEAEGLCFIHPFDDPAVIAGQGTLGLEMLAAAPDLDVLVVPIGGGGLIGGIATAAKAAWVVRAGPQRASSPPDSPATAEAKT